VEVAGETPPLVQHGGARGIAPVVAHLARGAEQ
jgi:hypothetical protein